MERYDARGESRSQGQPVTQVARQCYCTSQRTIPQGGTLPKITPSSDAFSGESTYHALPLWVSLNLKLMQRLLAHFLIVGALLATTTGWAQETAKPAFPDRGSSIHAGTLLFHYVLSVNHEHYRHSPDGRHHWGLGYGASGGWGFNGWAVGAHLMGSYWSGRGKNHFEARLGVAPTVFWGGEYSDTFVFPVPVVLIGYRRQAPGSPRFFFVNVGSVGVGFGFGTVLGGRHRL